MGCLVFPDHYTAPVTPPNLPYKGEEFLNTPTHHQSAFSFSAREHVTCSMGSVINCAQIYEKRI